MKSAGEAYDRRLQLHNSGLGLSEVVGAVCQWLGIETANLDRPFRRPAVVRARGLIGYIAMQELSISGNAVARRFNQNHSAVSRNADLVRTANRSLKQLARKPVN